MFVHTFWLKYHTLQASNKELFVGAGKKYVIQIKFATPSKLKFADVLSMKIELNISFISHEK